MAKGGRQAVKVQDVLSALQSEIAVQREREAFHAARESAHREDRLRHAAELERLTQLYQTLTSAADLTREIARRPRESFKDGGPRSRPRLTRMVLKVIEGKQPDERFGPAAVTQEIARRFGDRLRKPVDVRLISVALRRLHDQGRVRQVRKGRPHNEALYVKGGA
jgi:Mg2+ and Co2+ transporter CorA